MKWRSNKSEIKLTSAQEPKIDGGEEQEDAETVESPHYNTRFCIMYWI